MKKLFIIGLSMLMLIGLTASAFAVTDITLSGEIEIRGEMNDNTRDVDNLTGDVGAWYDENVRLRVDAKVTPNTSGVIELETSQASPYAGTNVNSDVWGQGASQATGGLAAGNTQTDNVGIREAYILHTGKGLLGIPSGLKIGRMSFKLGRGLFMDHSLFGDQGILLFAEPMKGMQIFFTTLKLGEGALAIGNSTAATPQSDDTDSYTLGFSNSVSGVNLSADITYADAQDFTTAIANPTGDTSEGLHLWNFGLRGDAKVGIANLYGDVEIQYGKAEANFVHRTTGSREDRDYRGFAILLGGKVDVKAVRVNLEFAYGSGDERDYSVANANDGNATFDTGDKNEVFMTSLGADQQHYTYVYEDRLPAATGARSTGLANTMYLKLGAETDVNPDLTMGGSIYMLRAADDTNAMGAAGARQTCSGIAAGCLRTSKDLGWEFDGNLAYKLDTNLVYFVQAGYLFTGQAYDIDDTTVGTVGVNKEADNAYVLRHGISLMF